jgi:DNA-binding CsgD family transcriptional regulator
VDVTDKPRLTPRQAEILGLISSGYSNSEIGMLIGLGAETVKHHAKLMFRVLGARNRAHAVTRGFQLGLLTIGSPESSFAPSGESPYE